MVIFYETTVHSNSIMKLKKDRIEAGCIVTGAMKLDVIDKLYK